MDAHTIDVFINGYYRGETIGAAVVEVAQPDGNFITGGGYLDDDELRRHACGRRSGSKMNFGFNVKYNKGSKPQPQGHVNIIFRVGATTYQIKSTSIDQSLARIRAGLLPDLRARHAGASRLSSRRRTSRT